MTACLKKASIHACFSTFTVSLTCRNQQGGVYCDKVGSSITLPLIFSWQTSEASTVLFQGSPPGASHNMRTESIVFAICIALPPPLHPHHPLDFVWDTESRATESSEVAPARVCVWERVCVYLHTQRSKQTWKTGCLRTFIQPHPYARADLVLQTDLPIAMRVDKWWKNSLFFSLRVVGVVGVVK